VGKHAEAIFQQSLNHWVDLRLARAWRNSGDDIVLVVIQPGGPDELVFLDAVRV
jgi:hypothetical protein